MTNFDQEKSLFGQKRRRIELKSHYFNGFREYFHRPWKLIFPSSLAALALATWWNRCLIPFPGDNSIPILCIVYGYVIDAIIIVVYFLLFVAVQIIVGTPPRAKETERRLVHIGLVDCYGYGPILLSCRKVNNSDVKALTFFSLGISKQIWERKQQALEAVLNIHLVEDVRYGGKKSNNGSLVVLLVAPGAVETNRGEKLFDDEL